MLADRDLGPLGGTNGSQQHIEASNASIRVRGGATNGLLQPLAAGIGEAHVDVVGSVGGSDARAVSG